MQVGYMIRLTVWLAVNLIESPISKIWGLTLIYFATNGVGGGLTLFSQIYYTTHSRHCVVKLVKNNIFQYI